MRASQLKINIEKLQKAVEVLEKDHKERLIPGYDAIVIHQGKEVLHVFGGYREDSEYGQHHLEENSLFDLASLTKIIATTTSILLLLEQGEIRLSDSVSYFIPKFGSRGKQDISIKQLLTHTSGLAAHRDFYAHNLSRDEILMQIYEQDLEYTPGEKMVYSDLGFIILGEIIAKVTGQSIDQFAQNLIFKPLGMKDTGYLPKHAKNRIAVTEYREALGRYLCGEVHDENAWALGGVAGHAGLFSTAQDVARYLKMWLNEGNHEGKQFLSPLTLQMATRSNTTTIAGANRGIGWVLKGDPWDASGDLSSDRVFSHTGFTGTSITIDPAYELGIVLLTNRVHYGRHIQINRTRARFHNCVYTALEG